MPDNPHCRVVSPSLAEDSSPCSVGPQDGAVPSPEVRLLVALLRGTSFPRVVWALSLPSASSPRPSAGGVVPRATPLPERPRLSTSASRCDHKRKTWGPDLCWRHDQDLPGGEDWCGGDRCPGPYTPETPSTSWRDGTGDSSAGGTPPQDTLGVLHRRGPWSRPDTSTPGDTRPSFAPGSSGSAVTLRHSSKVGVVGGR